MHETLVPTGLSALSTAGAGAAGGAAIGARAGVTLGGIPGALVGAAAGAGLALGSYGLGQITEAIVRRLWRGQRT